MTGVLFEVKNIIFQDSGHCGSCKYFNFDPGNPKKPHHYQIDEGTGEGDCLFWKFGTSNTSKACQKWKPYQHSMIR